MGLINISEAAAIGIYGLIYVFLSEEEYVPLKIVADKIGASENHLSKVFQRLTKMGYISSVRGPNGGFKLTKKGENATLLEIYESIDGKIETGECPLHRKKCILKKCFFSPILKKFTIEFKEHLQEIKIKSLTPDLLKDELK